MDAKHCYLKRLQTLVIRLKSPSVVSKFHKFVTSVRGLVNTH
ncbi:hypothetical protein BH10CYA1_BH10CYA1_62250 [soil metagenome]